MRAKKRIADISKSFSRTGTRVTLVVCVCCMVIAAQMYPWQMNAAGVPTDFVRIPAGEFMMGSPQGESERTIIENRHRVLVREFYLCQHEVTVGEFRQFIKATGYQTDAEKAGDSKNWQCGPNEQIRSDQELTHPVVYVSWNDAVAYCVWRSATDGQLYWLPTEAQWEYACRAGSATPFSTGQELRSDQANYNGNYPYKKIAKGLFRMSTTPVCSFSLNGWGIYDMHGNVYEWCYDWFGDDYYTESFGRGIIRDPKGPADGTLRIIRGGSWNSDAQYCRSAYRDSVNPSGYSETLGFRIVLIP